MAKQVRLHAAIPDNLHLVSRTHTVEGTNYKLYSDLCTYAMAPARSHLHNTIKHNTDILKIISYGKLSVIRVHYVTFPNNE